MAISAAPRTAGQNRCRQWSMVLPPMVSETAASGHFRLPSVGSFKLPLTPAAFAIHHETKGKDPGPWNPAPPAGDLAVSRPPENGQGRRSRENHGTSGPLAPNERTGLASSGYSYINIGQPTISEMSTSRVSFLEKARTAKALASLLAARKASTFSLLL